MEETSNCISIISFTEKGEALANRLSIYLLQSQKKDQVGCECDRDLVSASISAVHQNLILRYACQSVRKKALKKSRE